MEISTAQDQDQMKQTALAVALLETLPVPISSASMRHGDATESMTAPTRAMKTRTCAPNSLAHQIASAVRVASA